MKIVIAGIGKIGLTLARAVADEGHDVTVIDSDQSAVDTAHNTLDINGITGNAATVAVLEEAGADKADLLIATASTDELNILICLVARKLGAKRTIARVRDPEYARDLYRMTEELGLSMVLNPEQSAAEEILKILKYPSAMKIDTFAKGKVSLVEFRIDSHNPLRNRKIAELPSILPVKVLVCAILRGDNLIIPRGDDIIKEDDIIYVTAPNRRLYAFFRATGRNKSKLHNIMILGGGKIAFYLASELSEMGISTEIIESDRERCKELSETLTKVSIINGDGTDHVLLTEEGIDRMEGVVSLTGIDEENIIISMFAAGRGVEKVITKINRETLLGMVDNMGLESIITPARLTADRVIGYIRALQNSEGSSIRTLYRLVGGRVEAIEFQINADPELTGIPLSRLRLKKNLLIACIIRGNSIIFPTGADDLEPGDRVIVVTADRALKNLSDILSARS